MPFHQSNVRCSLRTIANLLYFCLNSCQRQTRKEKARRRGRCCNKGAKGLLFAQRLVWPLRENFFGPMMKCVKTLLMRLKIKLFKGHPLPNWLKIFQLFYGFRCCVAVTFSLPSYWAKWQWPKCNLYCQQNILPHPRLPPPHPHHFITFHTKWQEQGYISRL